MNIKILKVKPETISDNASDIYIADNSPRVTISKMSPSSNSPSTSTVKFVDDSTNNLEVSNNFLLFCFLLFCFFFVFCFLFIFKRVYFLTYYIYKNCYIYTTPLCLYFCFFNF